MSLHPDHDPGRAVSVREIAAACGLAGSIFVFHLLFPSHYYTYDSILAINPRLSLYRAHFGYQFIVSNLAQLYKWLGYAAGTPYGFVQTVQAGALSAVFGLIFLQLYQAGRGAGQGRRAGWFAGAVTIMLAMSGPGARFFTILEDYVLTALLIVEGIFLAFRTRPDGFARFLGPALCWTAAMYLDVVSALLCGPLFVFLAVRMVRERKFFGLFLVFAWAASPLLCAAHVTLNHPHPAQNFNWGGHGLSLANLSAFGVAGTRLLVYVISPSMPLFNHPGAKALVFAAISVSAVLLVLLAGRALAARRDAALTGLAAAVLCGAAVKTVFGFWWMPENSEQLIGPWLVTIATLALIAAARPGPACSPLPVRLAGLAAALVLAANACLVVVPASRHRPPYLDAVAETARWARKAGFDIRALLTDDGLVSMFYHSRVHFLARNEFESFPRLKVIFLSVGSSRPPSREEAASFEKRTVKFIDDILARDGRVFILLISRGLDATLDGTPNKNAAPDAGKNSQLASLGHIVFRHFRPKPGPAFANHTLWIISPSGTASPGTNR